MFFCKKKSGAAELCGRREVSRPPCPRSLPNLQDSWAGGLWQLLLSLEAENVDPFLSLALSNWTCHSRFGFWQEVGTTKMMSDDFDNLEVLQTNRQPNPQRSESQVFFTRQFVVTTACCRCFSKMEALHD